MYLNTLIKSKETHRENQNFKKRVEDCLMKHDEIYHITKYPAGHFSTLTALTKLCNNSNTPHLFPLIALSFTLFLAKCKIGRQSVNLWSQLWISHRRPTALKCLWVKKPNFCPSVLHLQPALISRSFPKKNTWLWPLPDYLVDPPSLLGHIPVLSPVQKLWIRTIHRV